MAACARVNRVMHAAENEVTIAVIGEVGVKFANHCDALFSISRFVRSKRHAQHRHAEYARGIGNRAGNGLVAGRHTVERAVRFDVIERHAFGVEKGFSAPV